MNAQDDSLLHGAAIGDRQGLWRLLNSLPVDQQVTEAFEPAWSVQANDLTTAAATDTDAIVRGMFQMLCNHLESPQAIAAFEPLSLLVLLRGGIHEFDAFVTTLGAVDETQAPHLMVLRPGVFVRLADRVLRAFTCAEVWPALGDLTSCQSAWSEGLLANQPRDPERFQLAMSLAMLSALVVFYHEFAHIIRGTMPGRQRRWGLAACTKTGVCLLCIAGRLSKARWLIIAAGRWRWMPTFTLGYSWPRP